MVWYRVKGKGGVEGYNDSPTHSRGIYPWHLDTNIIAVSVAVARGPNN